MRAFEQRVVTGSNRLLTAAGKPCGSRARLPSGRQFNSLASCSMVQVWYTYYASALSPITRPVWWGSTVNDVCACVCV